MELVESASTQRFRAKKEAILDSAAVVFNRFGIRGGTLTDVASGVGLVTNSVTYYYRKRDDLAEACLLRSIGILNEIVQQAAAETSVELRVRRLLRGYLHLIAEIQEGQQRPIMHLNDIKALTSPHAERVLEAYKQVSKKVRRLLIGAETGHLSKRELNVRSYLLMSMTQWSRLFMAGHYASDYEIIARRTADILLGGLAKQDASWPPGNDEEAFWSSFNDADAPGISDPFLRVGSRLINEHGYRGASIDRIAAELNLTKGAFYGRRDNKSDLVTECFDRAFLAQRLAWDRADAAGGSGWEKLCTGMSLLLWFQVSGQGPMLRWIATTSLPDEGLVDRVREAIRRASHRIENLLVDGMADGSVLPCSQSIASQMMGCVIDASAGLPRWEPTVTCETITPLYLRPALFGLLS